MNKTISLFSAFCAIIASPANALQITAVCENIVGVGMEIPKTSEVYKNKISNSKLHFMWQTGEPMGTVWFKPQKREPDVVMILPVNGEHIGAVNYHNKDIMVFSFYPLKNVAAITQHLSDGFTNHFRSECTYQFD